MVVIALGGEGDVILAEGGEKESNFSDMRHVGRGVNGLRTNRLQLQSMKNSFPITEI